MSEETKPESTNVIHVDFAVLAAFRELYAKCSRAEDEPELMWSAETGWVSNFSESGPELG